MGSHDRTEGFQDRLALAQTVVDLDVERRGEEGLVGRLLADERCRAMLVDGGLVAVPRRLGGEVPRALDCADDPAAPRPDAGAPAGEVALAFLHGSAARAVAALEGCLAIYLGTDRAEEPEVPYIALDITRATDLLPARRRGADAEADSVPAPLLGDARARFDWVELRSFAPSAPARDAGLATSAVAVSMWHAGQRFCPACGAPVQPALAGWAQTCSNPADPDRLLFPRIEPAVITAIVDDRDRILLQHNTAWRPRFFSVSAGFVETGESLEHAVAREAMEEVGIPLDGIRYLGSQPWPFPASIMLGFRAHATATEERVDHEEVASARWFTRAELERAVRTGEVDLPGRASIARHMIEDWFGGTLP
ncbi:NAD(+) diphosphatase [Enorma burkinafasonensis]|uniref:NAD(+) diphosphatase n=1 Tax=Enorma burkinafasonensis TaxID=2590867 RepID=UPI0026ED3716|nr:NAD(+) diphosphatase [Enorma burkinafasonensis]MCI7731427.1 NAD(+) diphosphatase [Enorma burkinafasonensis]